MKNVLGLLAFIVLCIGACGFHCYHNPIPTTEQQAAMRLYDHIAAKRDFTVESANILRYEESRLRNYEKAHIDSAGKLIPIASWPESEQAERREIQARVRKLKLQYNTSASRFNEFFHGKRSPFKEGSVLPPGRTVPLAELELVAIE